MKRYLALAMFLVLAVALVSPFSVSAKTKAGVKSGSFFYFFDKAFEKANLFFTFSPEKKAKKALENAEERLAEAEESVSENKPEAIAEAMENYQKNIEVLEKVLAKVPEEAKEAITKAIEADKERREEMTKKIEEINNEIKNEDNNFKKDEEEKSNDDVGDNENNEEENGKGNINENKKDEQKKEIEELKQNKKSQPSKINQSSEIEKLQKEIEDLKKQQPSSVATQKQNELTINTHLAQSSTPTTLSNNEFIESTILGYAKEAELLRFYIETLRNNEITDIKARRDKLAWRINLIRKDSFSGSDNNAILLNEMFDLYAQEHENEIKYIDENITYINYHVALLEGYRTEYNSNILSLSATKKIFTNKEMASTILHDMELFLRHFDPKINIDTALINHYQNVQKKEDTYAKEYAMLVSALSKISGPTDVGASIYQPMPQTAPTVVEFPKTTHCTVGSSGLAGELVVTCNETSF